MSYAASCPATAVTTVSFVTNGEAAKPQPGSFTPVSVAALRDQMTFPSIALSAFKIPVAPKEYKHPLLKVGVPRGPAPAFDSQNRVESRCLHTGLPLLIL